MDLQTKFYKQTDLVLLLLQLFQRDITGVTAGSGLTGGGSSGDVTLNVGAGTGIDVASRCNFCRCFRFYDQWL